MNLFTLKFPLARLEIHLVSPVLEHSKLSPHVARLFGDFSRQIVEGVLVAQDLLLALLTEGRQQSPDRAEQRDGRTESSPNKQQHVEDRLNREHKSARFNFYTSFRLHLSHPLIPHANKK